ncbi:sterol desaturase family protein [Leeia oryzae]|uniref:sterol desaturase family protein n=1 Tax=Leeia oryzae TaxID=356662 RepID=UPI000378F5F9|nr:sterol desaturase family protein [Leeia oryzae]
MYLFKLEHSRTAYLTDFALYALVVLLLALFLMLGSPVQHRVTLLAMVLLGLMGWGLVEYLLHRFVLHGVRPFSDWHDAHHQRPAALIYTPTLLSVGLIVILVFLPWLWLTNVWDATAVTLGLLGGYFEYTLTHHAIHHWRSHSAWLKQRKLWHGRHHYIHSNLSCFGVTSTFWDIVFNTGKENRMNLSQSLRLLGITCGFTLLLGVIYFTH